MSPVILRIVTGRLPAEFDASHLVELRERLGRAARDVPGLESLIVGARRTARPADADPGVEAATVTVWRDVALMARATELEEQARFLGQRLRLPLDVTNAVHYEIVGRTFAALPPDSPAYLRILTARARQNEEARLVETLRDQQPRLVDLGLVASHLGRRVVGKEVEAVTVGVWPDRASIRKATRGNPERPLFESDLADWIDRTHLETYDGIEIAPRLPVASGPPIYVIDEDLRIVDVTAAAAATMGWPLEDVVGHSMLEISLAEPEVRAAPWRELLEHGSVSGEGPWLVPDKGAVFLRFIAERDVPIVGRHTILIHRWHEPAPTIADMEQALVEAFPARAVS